jgi:hypothetical protein
MKAESQILCAINAQTKALEKLTRTIEEGDFGNGGGNQYSWTFTCSSVNGRQIKARITNANGAISYFEMNGTPVTDGSVSSVCQSTNTDESYDTITPYTVVGSTVTGYDNPTPAPFSIPSNTVHAISYIVLQGTASLKIGNNPSQTLTVGQGSTLEANQGLLSQSFTFSATSSNVVISVQTLS